MDIIQSFSTVLETVQSDKKLALLDDIDKLRSQGVSHYVHLPQLIVCGDQSSGKSSVLEAISGIPFPIKDNLCTRFATEVILRHASDTSISVAIVPSPTRSKVEQERLHEFRHTLAELEDFSSLVERAKDCMGVSSGSSAFSTDVLRFEISGPSQPHLTIVDLPGLIHSENKLQSVADVQLVQNMVREYMTNRRSIILAVISAKNDYANQIVLKLAREVDAQGKRTVGIITKPDTLPVGSESELAFLQLARNMDIEFRLGWHVLKNRDYEARQSSMEARDEAERHFFEQGVWKDLARDTVGVFTLREKLSEILFDQIKAELPALIDDIERQIRDCDATLARLGPSRVTIEQQRLFLLQISQDFQAVSKAAVDGSYGHEFFGDPRSKNGYAKRLRAVVQNLNVGFAETMRVRGQHRRIVDSDTIGDATARGWSRTVSRAAFIDEIRDLLTVTRGRELPGMFNPLIVGDLFFEQSRPWELLARQHVRTVWDAARLFLDLLLSHLASDAIADALFGQVIDPLMDQKLKELNDKLDELLRPYHRGHPITYNHYFTETIQRVKERRHEEEIAQKLRKFLGKKDDAAVEEISVKNVKMSYLLSALASRTEADMDRYACSEILDCMEAYYKVAMKSVIDNIATQAIEWCLIAYVGDLLSPSHVLQMDEKFVRQIAAESRQTQTLRERTHQKLAALQSGLEICQVHVTRKPSIRGRTLHSPLASLRATASDLGLGREDRRGRPSMESVSEGDVHEGLPESIMISSEPEAVTEASPSDTTLPAAAAASEEESKPSLIPLGSAWAGWDSASQLVDFTTPPPPPPPPPLTTPKKSKKKKKAALKTDE